MLRQLREVCCVASWAMLAVMTCSANARDNGVIVKQIQETIAKVRTIKGPSVARAGAAEHLADLTKGIDPRRVDDKTLADLVSLLAISDDSVQFWVAGSLGNLGPRARAAAPKLLEILPEADCRNGALTSAPAIREALKRMGVTPPPRPNCNLIGG